jgi:glucan-binding YG repeat protein
MKKIIRYYLLAICLVAGILFHVQTAGAEETEAQQTESEKKTVTVSTTGEPGWYKKNGYKYYYDTDGKLSLGWQQIDGKLYYFMKKASGDVPKGSMAVGLTAIGSRYFYFSKSGEMHTGWVKSGGKLYYFRKSGEVGTIGKSYSGYAVVGSDRYLFDTDGSVLAGWQTYKNYTYYGNTTGSAGTYGKLFTGGWKTIGSYRYYFSKKGVLQTNRWIGSYYVNEKGRMLKSTVTPDGWIVDKNGKKTKQASGWVKSGGKYYYYKDGAAVTGFKTINKYKYYFNSNGVRQSGLITVNNKTYYFNEYGVMQTGWQTIDGKKYYFGSNGQMAVNTTVGGIKLDENGQAETEISILLIAGHGQGDVGASCTFGSKLFQEYEYTREFATLIYQALQKKSTKITVTMYDQNYDCYQVVAGKKTGPSPQFETYDYVLEIHFNATVASLKDTKGDGSYKGVGIYVNSAKKDYSIDAAIVKAVAATGFKQWGCGVYASSGLLNAKTCQGKGISYGLLETAFIDDKDDMKFYLANKEKMAEAVAQAICNYYGV